MSRKISALLTLCGLMLVPASAHAALNRTVYNAYHTTSLPGWVYRSEGEPADGEPSVDAVYTNLGRFYSCLRTRFGRDSYDGYGAPLRATVHYSSQYNNVYWNGAEAVYGDGGDPNYPGLLAADSDLTYRIFATAMIDRTVTLGSTGESGAVRTAIADIFAAICETSERGTADSDVWRIAEDSWTPWSPGDALRYLDDPARDGVSSDYYPQRYTGTSDGGGAHWNAGIVNLAFKLLATGGRHPRAKTSTVVGGLGVDKAALIFYRALVGYLPDSASILDVRESTVAAAKELFGSSSPEVRSVNYAWDAVGVPMTLTSGEPLYDITGDQASERRFYLKVPAGASAVTFSISGGYGNADLYVRRDLQPTTDKYDCRPYTTGNSETCLFKPAAAGTYHVLIRGGSWYSGVALIARIYS